MWAIREEPRHCTKSGEVDVRRRQNGKRHAGDGQTFAQHTNQTQTDQADDKVLTPRLETCDNVAEQFEDTMARHIRRGSSRPGFLIRKITPAARFFSSRPLEILALLLALTCLNSVSAFAQTPDVDDIHVTPRVEADKPDAENALASDTVRTHSPLIRSKVDLVLVPVTITDPMNRLVTGLDRENFQLFEGKEAQEIKHFSSEDAPVSLGVIFDMSGSMSSKIERAREAVVEFFKTANPQDEFFMITFADKQEEISDFTQSVEDIQGKLVYTIPKGRTALLDAIYLGVSKMRQAKYPKKALLVISDGGDNHSRYTEGEIKSTVKEADLLMYAI